MDFLTFVDLTLKCSNREELRKVFNDCLSKFGIDGFIYSLVRGGCKPVSKIIHGATHSYPEDWMKFYRESNYVENDPTYRRIISTKGIFSWAELPKLVPYSKKDHQVMNEAEEAGLRRGMSVSIHGPFGEVVGFGFISKDKNEELSTNDLCLLYAMANQFHLVYSSFEKCPQPIPTIKLTDRQREILQYRAKGKTRVLIADILKISEETVDDHLERIYEKLEVNDIMLAVLKAINLGLITI